MDGVVRSLIDLRTLKFQLDDDFVDRCSRQYTASFLVLCSIILSARSYFAENIHCWCPENCASNHEAMDRILRALLDIRKIEFRLDDDFSDRLSRQYTASLLVLFAVLVSARTYFGEAIHCWCPEQCASNHEKYANIYCWVSDTYYVPFYEDMLQPHEPRDRKITYYQWTPVILVVQAVFFFIPCAIWRGLNRRSGVNIGVVMEAALSAQRAVYAESREKTLRYAVHLLDRYLLCQRDHRTGCLARAKQILSRNCMLVYGRFNGNYLTVCYLIVKCCYLVNAVGQLFLLDVILGYEYHLYGVHVLRHFILGEDMGVSERFPKTTMCDFRIRQNTNVHQYTVQCVLPVNLFNEKIFALIWFWFLLLAILTVLSLIHWLCKTAYWPSQYKFIRQQIRAMDSIQRESVMLKRFAENYLRRDGLFIIRLVSKNTGNMVAAEMLSGLWDTYGPKHRLLSDNSAKPRSGRTKRGKNNTDVPPVPPRVEVV